MVGDPKNLSDLDKIEADVRITCWKCGFEDDWTVAALSRHLHETGGSTVWSVLTRTRSCRRFGCGSSDVRALIVPYARRPANMPRRIGELDRRLVDTALAILTEAARNRTGSAATLEVRLALLVLIAMRATARRRQTSGPARPCRTARSTSNWQVRLWPFACAAADPPLSGPDDGGATTIDADLGV